MPTVVKHDLILSLTRLVKHNAHDITSYPPPLDNVPPVSSELSTSLGSYVICHTLMYPVIVAFYCRFSAQCCRHCLSNTSVKKLV